MLNKTVTYKGKKGKVITQPFEMLAGKACWVQFEDNTKEMCLLNMLDECDGST